MEDKNGCCGSKNTNDTKTDCDADKIVQKSDAIQGSSSCDSTKPASSCGTEKATSSCGTHEKTSNPKTGCC